MYNSRQALATAGVAKGTLIMTTRGLIPAEEVRAGDILLTVSGEWHPVRSTANGLAPTVILHGRDGRELECTPDQEIICADEPLQDGTWTEAKDAQGKYWQSPAQAESVPFPVPADRTLLNEDVFEIAGAYTAAGRTGADGRVLIKAAGGETTRHIESILQRVTKDWWMRNTETQGTFLITDRGLSQWLRDGFGAETAALPAWTLGLPDSWRTALWKGILETGARTGPEGACSIDMADKRSAASVLLLAQTLGMQGELSSTADGGCRVSLEPQPGTGGTPAVWHAVNGERSGSSAGAVFSFEVGPDNTFTANGIIVRGMPAAAETVLTEEAVQAAPA